VYDDSAPLPTIAKLSHQQNEHSMTFHLSIEGGSSAVVYQIDRAEINADCKCIGNWLRYYESSPSMQRLDLTRHTRLRSDKLYAFRLRVQDSLGRTSAWSNTIKSKRMIPHNKANHGATDE